MRWRADELEAKGLRRGLRAVLCGQHVLATLPGEVQIAVAPRVQIAGATEALPEILYGGLAGVMHEEDRHVGVLL